MTRNFRLILTEQYTEGNPSSVALDTIHFGSETCCLSIYASAAVVRTRLAAASCIIGFEDIKWLSVFLLQVLYVRPRQYSPAEALSTPLF